MALESIALIPSGYKATKVYSQLPVNGNGDFTFDRGTSADQTRVNKNGLIESVAQDVPRLDYLDGGCPSLLLEPASTNLVTYSEDFSNVAWSKINATISANAVLSPDGSVNADKLVEDTSSNQHRLDFASTNSAVDTVFSVFAKKAERDSIWVRIGTSGAYFDLTNGLTSIISGVSSFIEDYGNGWYRCIVVKASSSANEVCRINITQSYKDSSDYLGDGTSGVYLYGAQHEQQSYATSYVRSLSGVSGVRNAETCNGAGTTAEINSQEGVLFAEIRALADDSTFRLLSLSDGTANERITLGYNNSTNTQISTFATSSSITSGIINFDAINITEYSKVAVKYSLGTLNLYINGVFVGSSLATLPSGLDDLGFDSGAGGSPFYGRVKKLSVYDQALSTTELETLTGFTSFAEMSSYLSYS